MDEKQEASSFEETYVAYQAIYKIIAPLDLKSALCAVAMAAGCRSLDFDADRDAVIKMIIGSMIDTMDTAKPMPNSGRTLN